MVRDPCNLYTKEPFPQSHAGEQYTVSSRRSLSLSLQSISDLPCNSSCCLSCCFSSRTPSNRLHMLFQTMPLKCRQPSCCPLLFHPYGCCCSMPVLGSSTIIISFLLLSGKSTTHTVPCCFTAAAGPTFTAAADIYCPVDGETTLLPGSSHAQQPLW